MSEPKLTLQQFAWVNAALDAGRPRSEILTELGLDLPGWQTEQHFWLTTLARRSQQNQLDLAQRYTAEYMKYRDGSPLASSAAAEAPVRPRVTSPSPAVVPAELPPKAAEASPPPALTKPEVSAPGVPRLSLYEFAMLRAELDVSADVERACSKYGLVEASARQQEFESWQRLLQADRSLQIEFKRIHADARRHWQSLLARQS